MSVADEIQTLETYLGNAYSKCADKGATIPQNRNMQNLTACIDSIQGGGTVVPPEAGTLTGIFVNVPPQIYYVEGDPLDLTGCVILGSYSNGGYYDVTANCDFICNDPVTFYDTKITVQYGGFSVDIPITVTGRPVLAPSTTTVLAHFDGNMINEVTGSALAGTYSQQNGKWNKAQQSGNNSNYSTFTTAVNRDGGFTVEFWAKNTASGTNPMRYCVKGSGTTESPIFKTSANITTEGFKLNYVGSGQMFITETIVNKPSSALNTSQFYHYAFVFDETTMKFYLDGTLMTEGVINTLALNFNLVYPQVSGAIDEFLACHSKKYVSDFVPNHAPYYLQSND